MKIPVHNTSAMPIYVAAQMIPAGETRHFDEEQVEPHLRPAPAPEPEPVASVDPQGEAIAEILSHRVADIVGMLDALKTEELERLGAEEQKGQARKGVLSAVAEKLLTRAGDPPPPPGGDSGAGERDPATNAG